jgi:hypothetical protein
MVLPEAEIPPPEKPPEPEPEVQPEITEFNPDVPQNLVDNTSSDTLTFGDPNINDTSQGSGGSTDDKAGIGSGYSTETGFEQSVVKSPLVFKGLFAQRTAGGRRGSVTKYGGGIQGTEAAVLRALRWLKKNQEYNGSWTTSSGGGSYAEKATPGMTGLALLTFLAHGETPASEEFGETIQKAIEWLVANQNASGRFAESDKHEYSMPIATYALCEAFALTKVPIIKAAAEKAVEVIIKGQGPGGIWNYNCDGSGRQDTTYSSWCAQALKAAKMAELYVDGLEPACKKLITGFEANQSGSGGFGYIGPGDTPLTALAVLSIQLHGGANRPSVQRGLQWLQQASCDWANPWGKNPLYFWYYATQAKFQGGGDAWNAWNKQFAPALMKSQTVIPKAIADPKGKLVDIGYWTSPSASEFCKSYVYNTTLCALMLQVYYRYLPTYKVEEPAAAGAEPSDASKKPDDAKVNIEIL